MVPAVVMDGYLYVDVFVCGQGIYSGSMSMLVKRGFYIAGFSIVKLNLLAASVYAESRWHNPIAPTFARFHLN